MRETAMTAIEGISPVTRTDRAFLRDKAEFVFLEWAESEPQAAFRRFAFVNNFDREPPDISNKDVERERGTISIMVGYPLDFRYGGDAFRDMENVIDEDFESIDNVVGHRATTFVDGCFLYDSQVVERGEFVATLTITYRYNYLRSV